MREKNWLTKIIVILVGSIISAYGITLAMYAGFGSATLAVLWQGVSKVTGMSIGMTSFVIAVVMIVFVWFYDLSQIHIGTVLYQVVYSGFVEIFSRIQRQRMWSTAMGVRKRRTPYYCSLYRLALFL